MTCIVHFVTHIQLTLNVAYVVDPLITHINMRVGSAKEIAIIGVVRIMSVVLAEIMVYKRQ